MFDFVFFIGTYIVLFLFNKNCILIKLKLIFHDIGTCRLQNIIICSPILSFIKYNFKVKIIIKLKIFYHKLILFIYLL